VNLEVFMAVKMLIMAFWFVTLIIPVKCLPGFMRKIPFPQNLRMIMFFRNFCTVYKTERFLNRKHRSRQYIGIYMVKEYSETKNAGL
jgi:hypothetical protein